jgi:hypothetical protein
MTQARFVDGFATAPDDTAEVCGWICDCSG